MADLQININLQQALAAIRNLKEQLKGLDNINVSSSAFDNLEGDIKRANNAIKSLGSDFRAGKVSVETYNNSLKALNTQLQGLENAQRASATGFNNIKNSIVDAAGSLPVFGGALQAAMTSPAALAITALVGVGAAIKSIITSASDAEASFDSVDALLRPTGGSSEELAKYALDFENLKERIIEVGAASPYSTKEVSDLAAEFASAGRTASETAGLLEAATNLTQTDRFATLSQAGALLNSTMAMFGMTVGEAQKTVDQLAKTGVVSKATLGDLEQSLLYLAPAAASAGMELDETLTVIGLLGNRGLLGGAATRALTTAMSNFAKPTKEAGIAIEQLGLKTYDANGQFVGLENIFTQLSTSTAGLTQQQKDAALATIFGNEALGEALILIDTTKKGVNGAASEFESMRNSILNSAGAAAQISAIRMDNLQGDVEKLGGAWEAFKVQLGTGSLDALRGITQGITAIIDAFSTLISLSSSFGQTNEEASNIAVNGANNVVASNEEVLQSIDANTFAAQNMSSVNQEAANATIAGNQEVQYSWSSTEGAINAVIGAVSILWSFITNGAKFAINVLTGFAKFVGAVGQGIVNNGEYIGSSIVGSFRDAFSFISKNVGVVAKNIASFLGGAFEFASKNVSIAANNIASGFKSAGAKAANFFISNISKIVAPINSILSEFGLGTISLPTPTFDTGASTQAFVAFKAQYEELQGFVKSERAPFVPFDFSGVSTDFGDIKDAFAGFAKDSYNAVKLVAEGTGGFKKKVDDTKKATADLNKVIKDLDKTVDNNKITDAGTGGGTGGGTGTGGGGSRGGGGGASKAKEEKEKELLTLEQYAKKAIELEKTINEAREAGRAEELANAKKDFEKLEKDLIDAYDAVPDTVLKAVDNQELFVKTTEELVKKEQDYLKEVAKVGDAAIKSYDKYSDAVNKVKDAELDLQKAIKDREANSQQRIQDIDEQGAKNAKDRAFELAEAIVKLDAEAKKLNNELAKETDNDRIVDLQSQLLEIEKERTINKDLLSKVGGSDAVLAEAEAYSLLTEQQKKQLEFEKEQKAIEQERLIIGKSRAELEALVAGGTLDANGVKLANKELQDIAKIEELQAKKTKLEEEQAALRKTLEEDIAKVRLDSIDKAYEKDIDNANKIKDIWKEINTLRDGNSSGVAGATGVFHAGYVPSKGASGREMNAIIRRNEAVINPSSTIRSRGLLDSINRGALTDRMFEKIINNTNNSTVNKNKVMNGGVKIVVQNKRAGLDIWNDIR